MAGGSCYVIATSARDLSVPRHFRALAAELAARGHRVIVIVDRRRRDVERPEGNPSILTWPSPRPTRLRDAAFLRQLIATHHPDCLIANFGSTNVMMLVGALSGVRCRVCWYHTLSGQIDLDAHRSPYVLALLRLRKRLVYRAATAIVPVSHAAAKDLREVFGVAQRKIRVFHNAVADPFASAGMRPAECRPRDLICAGRMHTTKGQDVLIDAIALLRNAVPDIRVRFAGDGPSRARCEELARRKDVANRCDFVGVIDPDRLLDLMAGAAATIVPSLIDNCPMVIVESLAVGTPVIASAVGGIPEMITHGCEGFLVPPGNASELAIALKRLLTDPELAAEMSRRARCRFLLQFHQRKTIATQVDWLESMTGRRTAV